MHMHLAPLMLLRTQLTISRAASMCCHVSSADSAPTRGRVVPQGNCSEAPPPEFLTAARTGSRAPLLPLAPLQCMLLADSSVLAVPEDTYVWLDGLYLRFLRTARSPRHPVLASIGSAQAFTEDKQRSGTLFMTAMAFQGDQVYGNAAAGETSVAGISHVHPEMAGSAEACRILLDGAWRPRPQCGGCTACLDLQL